MTRAYRYCSDVRAACWQCHGGIAYWFSKNAQAVAAIHARRYGHSTWVEVATTIEYGPVYADKPGKEPSK